MAETDRAPVAEAVGEAVSAALASRKYRDLPESALRRIAEALAPAHPRAKELAKALKAKLHQVTGLYFEPADAKRADRLLEGIEALPPAALLDRAREFLALHVSTAERLAHLADFYGKIFAATGAPARLLDVACGANAFALPFMGLPAGTEYFGADIDRRLVDGANRFLSAAGLPGRCLWRDAFDDLSDVGRFDVALILKTLPCLERQARGAGAALLARVPAATLVVSFPARSVGGRDVGMANQYDAYLREAASSAGFHVTPLDTPYEPAYVLRRSG